MQLRRASAPEIFLVVDNWPVCRTCRGADHGSVGSLNAGMDQTMSGGFSAAITSSILSGAVPQSRIDDAVMRILTQLFAVGVFDRTDYGTKDSDVRSKEHDALNVKFAVAST